MYYNARWYDPYLNRWAQPDSIIPDPSNPLDFDRYSYVRNNPVRYTDPTGHCAKNYRDDSQCWNQAFLFSEKYNIDILDYAGNEFWDAETLELFDSTLTTFRDAIGEPEFDKYLGGTDVSFGGNIVNGNTINGQWWDNNLILTKEALSDNLVFAGTVLHELTHGLISGLGTVGINQVDLFKQMVWVRQESFLFFWTIARDTNPMDGPTRYSRFYIDGVEEDLAETVTSILLPGFAQYGITPNRYNWYTQFLEAIKVDQTD